MRCFCKKMEKVSGPDHIYYNGKILTVDKNCSIQQAFAVSGDRFLFAGLADSHCHPSRAALTELEEEIPVPQNVQELLDWVRKQVSQKPAGEWIVAPRIFSTRLCCKNK